MSAVPADPLFDVMASETHLATEVMLREVLEYLQRLPAHPMTTAMLRKVQAHLDSPAAGIVRDRDRRRVAAARAVDLGRGGQGGYVMEGYPELCVSIAEDVVLVASPAAERFGTTSRGRAFALALAAQLAKGYRIDLSPLHDERNEAARRIAQRGTSDANGGRGHDED